MTKLTAKNVNTLVAIKALAAVLALTTFVPSASANSSVDLSKPIPEVRLTTGKTYTNLVIVSFGEKTIMAKWDGGRGTITVSDLPPEVKKAILDVTAARAQTKESAAPKPKSEETKSPLANVTSKNFEVKVFERNETFVRVAWKATLTNSSHDPVTLRAKLIVLDEKEFKLDEEKSDYVAIPAGKSHEISETSLITIGIYDQMKTWRLQLETR